MRLRYRYRLYPSPGQRAALARAFGCARVVFNDGLAARRDAHEAGLPYLTDADLSARLTAPKKTPERAWLGEVSSVVLQQALADLNTAQGPAAVDPIHCQRSVQGHGGREAAAAEDRGRALSRKAKGGRNRDKARARVARVHAKVADSRRDWLHKESTHIVRENQAVYMEDLCVAGLGRTFARIGRFEPTSQMCSACGVKDGPKPLNVRQWTCAACGAVHDRDVNAARNVLALGRRESLNACGGQVRPAPVLAPAGETGSHRGAA